MRLSKRIRLRKFQKEIDGFKLIAALIPYPTHKHLKHAEESLATYCEDRGFTFERLIK